MILFSPSVFCLPVGESPFLPGPCPKVNPISSVDLSLYSGSWSQVALFPNVTAPLVGHGYKPDLLCVTVKYLQEEESLKVINSGLDTETDNFVSISGTIKKTEPNSKTGNLKLHLEESIDLPDEEYQVLATDYKSYASVWNCKEFPMLGILVRREFAWILARENILSADGRMPDKLLDTAMKVYEDAGIDITQFSFSGIDSC